MDERSVFDRREAISIQPASTAKAISAKNVLEIGTYLGVGTLALAANLGAGGKVYSVDLPDNSQSERPSRLNAIDEIHVLRSRFHVGEAFLKSPLRDRMVQIRADSLTFRAEKHVDEADLVVIDGRHSLPLISKDTDNAFKILGPRGVVLWDDYFYLYSDVVSFLDELSTKYALFAIGGTNLVIYSPRWGKGGGQHSIPNSPQCPA